MKKIDRRWGFGKKEVSLGMILLGLGLFLFAPLRAQQEAKAVFVSMPDSLSPLLTAVNRADFIDFLENSLSFEMLSPNEMRLSSRGAKESIGMSGKNLPSFIKQMTEEQKASFMNKLTRLFGDRISDLDVEIPGRPGWMQIVSTEKYEDKSIQISSKEMSDGMLRLLAFVAIINCGEIDVLLCCLAYGVTLFAQALYLITYWYQAKLLSKYLSILSIIAYLTTTLYKVFLLINQAEVWLFALSYSIDYGVIAVIGIIIFKQKSRKALTISKVRCLQLLNKSKYFIIPNIMLTILGQTDKLMLKWMMGNEEIGLYTAAYNCAGVLAFVFVAIIDSFRPAILESNKTDSGLFAENM